jgi:methionyl-tRNA formyltransferase
MNYKSLRIIFLGTPDFAVASLQKLVEASCNIVGVVTAPDKPAGRGMQIQQSAVKKYALEQNLQVLQPEKLKSESFIADLKLLNADLQVVVAFRMLPEIVWNMPTMGTINVHGSLLPQYRGAAPINWAIINGEKFTGVTTFKLKQEIDTGNILLQKTIPISENINVGELYDEMKEVGANLLLTTIEKLANNSLKEKEQDNETALFANTILKKAPKIFTETCIIDWNKTVEEVYNLVRGLSPYPAAFTYLQNKKLKIFYCQKEVTKHTQTIGEFDTDHKSYIKIACSNGYISLLDIQLEGKKRMKVIEFLRGYRF